MNVQDQRREARVHLKLCQLIDQRGSSCAWKTPGHPSFGIKVIFVNLCNPPLQHASASVCLASITPRGQTPCRKRQGSKPPPERCSKNLIKEFVAIAMNQDSWPMQGSSTVHSGIQICQFQSTSTRERGL